MESQWTATYFSSVGIDMKVIIVEGHRDDIQGIEMKRVVLWWQLKAS